MVKDVPIPEPTDDEILLKGESYFIDHASDPLFSIAHLLLSQPQSPYAVSPQSSRNGVELGKVKAYPLCTFRYLWYRRSYPRGRVRKGIPCECDRRGGGQLSIYIRERHFFLYSRMKLTVGALSTLLQLIPGHEAVGKVVKMGKNVKGFSMGDRCVADVGITCGICFFCRRGESLFCESFAAKGVATAGGFAEYIT